MGGLRSYSGQGDEQSTCGVFVEGLGEATGWNAKGKTNWSMNRIQPRDLWMVSHSWQEQSAERIGVKWAWVCRWRAAARCIKRSTIACCAAWPQTAPRLGRERGPAGLSGDCKDWKTSTPARWSQNGPNQTAQTGLGCALDSWSRVPQLGQSHRSWNGSEK